ncbi:MAG: hypothetical protein WC184_07335 [Acidimicrobiia bacterium]
MSDDDEPLEDKTDAAQNMLAKLRRFMDEELQPDERQALSALLAPGIASVYKDPEDDEVTGFQVTSWLPEALPNYLSQAVRVRSWHVEGT